MSEFIVREALRALRIEGDRMIETVADLLADLKHAEQRRIDAFGGVPHAPIIGDMYEGLTKALLGKAIFAGLRLSICDGFVEAADGTLSKQVDVMLVTGAGRQIPHTDHWIYPAAQVVAVISVKKNLYGSDLREAFLNIDSTFLKPTKARVPVSAVATNFRTITGVARPASWSDLPPQYEEIWRTLSVEVAKPLTVVFGHFGYASELGLRNGFKAYLDSHPPEGPSGALHPNRLPDLVICREAGIVKVNGLPYSYPMQDGWWAVNFTFGSRPLYFLLEMLWTKLAVRFDLSPEVFGEDLVTDNGSPLLMCQLGWEDESFKWRYSCVDLSAADLASRPDTGEWAPVEILPELVPLLGILGANNELDPADPELETYAETKGTSASALVRELLRSGLVFEDPTGRIRYLTRTCAWAALPDGRVFAADAHDGRFLKWLEKRRVQDSGGTQ